MTPPSNYKLAEEIHRLRAFVLALYQHEYRNAPAPNTVFELYGQVSEDHVRAAEHTVHAGT